MSSVLLCWLLKILSLRTESCQCLDVAGWGWQCHQNIKKNGYPGDALCTGYRVLDQYWSADLPWCVWIQSLSCWFGHFGFYLLKRINHLIITGLADTWVMFCKSRVRMGARLLGTERSTILDLPEEKWFAASFPVCSGSLSWIHLRVNTHFINSFILDLRLVLTSFFHVDPMKMDLLQAPSDQCFLFKSVWIKKI